MQCEGENAGGTGHWTEGVVNAEAPGLGRNGEGRKEGKRMPSAGPRRSPGRKVGRFENKSQLLCPAY